MRVDSSNTTADFGCRSERATVATAWAQFQGRNRAAPGSQTAMGFSVPGYRMLSEIHRGGQGIVCQAIQESTRKKVAIKILRHGPLADAEEFARFDREIDVLGRIEHPNIVGIHDRGQSGGIAYFVMDFVPGRPLDAHVAGESPAAAELLELFAEICDAVHFAHLRGVIHRDLKPANIRVDLEGRPHVLDFGLAKFASDERGSAGSEMTRTGRFIGSLPWASPEQTEGRSERIDLRTDVYSLGVMLYQLVTGAFPYPVTGPLDEIVHHIRRTSPARPSLARPGIDPDLERVLLKCLAKEPEQRYPSAGDLAADLRRVVAHEPVSAREPSAAYHLRKFVRRHRGTVAAAAALAATLLLAMVVSLAFAFHAARERRAAQQAVTRAERAEAAEKQRADELAQVARFQQRQLAGVDARALGVRLRAGLLQKVRAAAPPEERDARAAELETLLAGSDFTGLALEALEANVFQPALAAIAAEFDAQPLLKAELLQTMAGTLRELGLHEPAAAPQEQALAIRRAVLGDDERDTLASLIDLAALQRLRGRMEEAEPLIREALARTRAALGEDDPLTLDALHELGRLLWSQGKLAEAEQVGRAALAGRRRVLGEDHPDTVVSLTKLGGLLRSAGRLDEAEPYCREGLDRSRRIHGEEHPGTLIAITNLASLLKAQGKAVEAETYCREALEKSRRVLGDNHPDTLTVLGNLGGLLYAQGKLADAEPVIREVLDKRRRLLGELHPLTLTAIINMGPLLWTQDKRAEAESYFREALSKSRRVLGDDHPETLTALNNMGVVLRAQGKLVEAEPLLLEALEQSREKLGPEHADTLISLANLANLQQALDRPREALSLLAPAEPAARRVFVGAEALQLGRILRTLGRAYASIGELSTAEAYLLESEGIMTSAAGGTDRDRAEIWEALAQLCDAQHAQAPAAGDDVRAAAWRGRAAARDSASPSDR